MASVVMAEPSKAVPETSVLDDELPELSTLLGRRRKTASADKVHNLITDITKRSPPRRCSPRRRKKEEGNPPTRIDCGMSAISLSASSIKPPPVSSPVKRPHKKGTSPESSVAGPSKSLVQPRVGGQREAITSMQQGQRSLKLTHVDSLLFPLSRVASAWKDDNHEIDNAGPIDLGVKIVPFNGQGLGITTKRTGLSRGGLKRAVNYSSCFVLREARCVDDDFDDTNVGDEDEELTDLSGFIVDDDAELSLHDSDVETESEIEDTNLRRKAARNPPGERGRPRGTTKERAVMEEQADDSYKFKDRIDIKSVGKDLFNGDKKTDARNGCQEKNIEIIDLTDSPLKLKDDPRIQPKPPKRPGPTRRTSSDSNPFDSEKDAFFKFSPPRSYSPAKIPSKPSNITNPQKDDIQIQKPTQDLNSREKETYTTPPTTPPASPTKLKSPSKLLSPSKRGGAIPISPHRQSIDAFWSSEVINTWNDQYSPRKGPLTASPYKRGLARFNIWSEPEDENGFNNNSDDVSSDQPSPCTSPRKASKSPAKSQSSSEKKRFLGEKRAAAAAKEQFESSREQIAHSLLNELDTTITSGKLASLSASTGGVKLIWSKNLRSTAGRANWRRTVTKVQSDSPIKGSDKPGAELNVQHYASIELAEKVIDNEERLVNTLSHEFCHLANFMVSGVKDQPHGASFKAWADKVTRTLRKHPDPLYRAVEVTTKHSYVINHKYLWACAGSVPSAARAFLAIEDDPGCGAEYGRHSKSIDPEKHRCGKCKGLLVQVRPKPRKADPQRKSPRKGASPFKKKVGGRLGEISVEETGKDSLGGLVRALGLVEVSD